VNQPWEHPDWYDLHDNTWTAGIEREPEHYREFVIALPPLDVDDHLIDFGAGTGKVTCLIARSYPNIGRITLVEPNQRKLERAVERVIALSAADRVHGIAAALGDGNINIEPPGTIAVVGSVFMPALELSKGTLRDGLAWLSKSLQEIAQMLTPDSWLYCLETLALPWASGSLDDPVRRLTLLEFIAQVEQAGFMAVECVYRFRDRIVVRARVEG
jgi:SAM-dependent methyltransferase